MWRRLFSVEDRVLFALLVFVPISLAAGRFGLPAWATFFLSVAAVVPLAGLIGSATEALAVRIGARAGGLLNATFGNAPDLLVGVFGVQRGLIPLVKATLVGALISNSALIMGLCYLVAGLRYGRPSFRRREAGHHSVLLMLALAGIAFPSVAGFEHQDQGRLFSLSAGAALVLLAAYVAYVVYAIFGLESVGPASRASASEVRGLARLGADEGKGAWPLWLSLGLLAATTIALIPVVDVLTGSVQEATRTLGWTDVFAGIIVVANAGNVAEGYAAIKFSFAMPGETGGARSAEDSGLDLALGIASASSIQIATFVAPLVVLYSAFAHPMTLVFNPIEIVILALLVIVFAYVAQDGESNWLEGAQLLALYALAGIVFFVLPSAAFAS
jgi:Ca2+:H+ antiporter